MKKVVINSLIIFCFTLGTCEREKDDCSSVRMVHIRDAIIPDTVSMDEPVQISVQASATNLCWRDLYLELRAQDAFTYSLQSYGTFLCCEGLCVCPEEMLYKDTVITFQPARKGKYYFNIAETQGSVAVDSLIVE
jgi:hypothetical protein